MGFADLPVHLVPNADRVGWSRNGVLSHTLQNQRGFPSLVCEVLVMSFTEDRDSKMLVRFVRVGFVGLMMVQLYAHVSSSGSLQFSNISIFCICCVVQVTIVLQQGLCIYYLLRLVIL